MTKNVYWSSCKVPAVLVRYVMKLEFSRQIFEKKILKYKISLKFVQW
jgi:hypothetical protein